MIKFCFSRALLRLSPLLLVFYCLFPLAAQAHWADMAAMELDVQGQQAQANLTVATPFFEQADTNQDGRLSAEEVTAGQPLIQTILAEQVQLIVNNEPAELQIEASALEPIGDLAGRSNMSTLVLKWQWKSPAKQMRLKYALFPEDAPQAHCLVSLNHDGQFSSLILDRKQTQVDIQEPQFVTQVLDFVSLGLEHIATGYDHLLFLLALLLAGGSLKYLIKIVTAFTLAHSITLSLAVIGWVHAPSRIVESLIAASIMYVVIVEVLWKKQETPGYVVFIFGLIHGLGFANILKEMALPTSQLITALLSFNLGIELGQMAIVLIFFGLLHLLRKKEDWYPKIQMASAYLILCMAGYWLFERAILGV